MIQSWVELKVRNNRGETVFASGERDERNFLKPGTFLFKAEPVDQYGNLIDRHNLWDMVGVRYRRSLFPGYSDMVEYSLLCPSGGPRAAPETLPDAREFTIPAAKAGTLRIAATLQYRKVNQFLLNYVLGEETRLTTPIVDIASATAEVPVVSQRR
jgi:hypothetical protein